MLYIFYKIFRHLDIQADKCFFLYPPTQTMFKKYMEHAIYAMVLMHDCIMQRPGQSPQTWKDKLDNYEFSRWNVF